MQAGWLRPNNRGRMRCVVFTLFVFVLFMLFMHQQPDAHEQAVTPPVFS